MTHSRVRVWTITWILAGWLLPSWATELTRRSIWYTVQKVHLVQFCLCQMDILVKQNGQIQILTEKVSE